MFEQLGSQLGKLLGKPGEDQASTITAAKVVSPAEKIQAVWVAVKR